MIMNVFMAFQFANSLVPRSDKETALINAINQINQEHANEGKSIELSWKDFDLDSGSPVGSQIYDMIDNSDIFIVDLTELNKNVLFELGIAYSHFRNGNKGIIWIAHKTIDFDKMPSDIKGLFIYTYEKNSLKSILSKSIKEKSISLLSCSNYAHKSIGGFWRLFHESADILCSEIPKDSQPYYADPKDRNYLRYAKFADLDSLLYLKASLSRYFPNVNFRDFSPSEYFDSNSSTLFVIGGPPWNPKYREYQKFLPFCFEQNPLGEDDPLCLRDSRKKLYPHWTDSGEIEYDISVYTKLKLNTRDSVHLFGGCLTFGVLGAIKAFMNPNVALENISFLKSIVADSDSFSVIFSTKVINSTVIPSIINFSDLFYIYSGDVFREMKLKVKNEKD